jgi:hypothetical protein
MAVSINWLAVLVAVIAQFVCGFLWYGPFFGKKWMSLVGKSEEELKKSNPGLAYTLALICAAVVAIGLSCLVDLLSWQTAWGGIKLGFFVWLGFTVTAMVMNDAFEGKPPALTSINAGYHLLYMMVMGAIVGVWQ